MNHKNSPLPSPLPLGEGTEITTPFSLGRRVGDEGLRFCLIALITLLICVIAPSLQAQSPAPQVLMQQGREFYTAGQFEQALYQWQAATRAYGNDEMGVAGSLINQGQALSAMGLQRRACKTLVKALQEPQTADESLCDPATFRQSFSPASSLPDHLQALGLRNLGEVLRLIGNLDTSQTILLQSWKLAPDNLKPDILLSLGNVARDLGNRDRDRKDSLSLPLAGRWRTDCFTISQTSAAMDYYQQAIACYQQTVQTTTQQFSPEALPDALPALQAQLNHLSLLLNLERWWQQNDQPDAARAWKTQISAQTNALLAHLRLQIQQLPRTHDHLFAQINFARSLVLHQTNQKNNQKITTKNSSLIDSTASRPILLESDLQLAWQLLNNVLENAKDPHQVAVASYAAGNLGWLCQQTGNLSDALTWSDRALNFASQIQSADLLYQWEWQKGRILRQQEKPGAAIAAYEQAVRALQVTRDNLIAINPDAQFSLRDTTEPVYRELIDLYLPVNRKPDQKALNAAIESIGELQIAEMENFLGCQLSVHKRIHLEDLTAAVVYSIVLPDRLEVIVQLPQGSFHHHRILIGQSELKQRLQEVRRNIALEPNSPEFDLANQKHLSGEVYNWLIRPLETSLKQNSIKTLVFVSDGLLRTIPMAALYDTEQQSYLVDQYRIGTTPGLRLLDAKRYNHHHLNALIAGLTIPESVNLSIQGEPFSFDPLKNVTTEVRAIQTLLPNSELLLGKNFTSAQFRQKLSFSSYPIVHIATHGHFSSDPFKTFILANAGQIVTIDQMYRGVRDRQEAKPTAIELLVFSACQTAIGDRRATLGFAGAAIRAGANSTLGSLWAVNDESTALMMQHFYQALLKSNPAITKAEALRIAQQTLRTLHPHYKLPYYWAPFVLVGNWL